MVATVKQIIIEKSGGCLMDNSKEFQLMLDKAIECEPLAFKGFDRTKNVQDQLQEMVANGDCAYDLFHRFEIWVNYYDGEISQLELSMEQLWLAFVMKENHNKVWSDEGWVNG